MVQIEGAQLREPELLVRISEKTRKVIKPLNWFGMEVSLLRHAFLFWMYIYCLPLGTLLSSVRILLNPVSKESLWFLLAFYILF